MKFRVTYANVVSTLALLIALSGGAYAANGGSLILGRSNSASSLTEVRNPGGTAFSFRSKSGRAPFTVNGNSVKVSGLNADKVDGLDSTQLRGAAGPAGPAGPQGPQGPAGAGATTVSGSQSFSATDASPCPEPSDEGQCKRTTVTMNCPAGKNLFSAIAHTSTHRVSASNWDDNGNPISYEAEDQTGYSPATGDGYTSEYIAGTSGQPTGIKFNYWSFPLNQGESESGTVKLWGTCA